MHVCQHACVCTLVHVCQHAYAPPNHESETAKLVVALLYPVTISDTGLSMQLCQAEQQRPWHSELLFGPRELQQLWQPSLRICDQLAAALISLMQGLQSASEFTPITHCWAVAEDMWGPDIVQLGALMPGPNTKEQIGNI